MSTFLHFLIQNTLAGSAFLLLILLFRRFTGNLSKLYVRLLWLLALPVLLLFEGGPTGISEDVAQEELDNQYSYYAGSQIAFRFVEEKILLPAELAGYSEINHVGEFPGHEPDADVRYLGEGKWELEDIRYADANLNTLIAEAVPLHLTVPVKRVPLDFGGMWWRISGDMTIQ